MVPAKPGIAHFAGSNATVHSIPQPVISNKARANRGIASLADAEGARPRLDMLWLQRPVRPITVYIEQFSAHLLEADAAGLYACRKAIPMRKASSARSTAATATLQSTRSSCGWETACTYCSIWPVRPTAAPGTWMKSIWASNRLAKAAFDAVRAKLVPLINCCIYTH
jgi:hypothetical protein